MFLVRRGASFHYLFLVWGWICPIIRISQQEPLSAVGIGGDYPVHILFIIGFPWHEEISLQLAMVLTIMSAPVAFRRDHAISAPWLPSGTAILLTLLGC